MEKNGEFQEEKETVGQKKIQKEIHEPLEQGKLGIKHKSGIPIVALNEEDAKKVRPTYKWFTR